MTFLEGAIEILRQKNNREMTATEIWTEIAKQNLVKTKGKTPEASLGAILYRYTKDGDYNQTLFNATGYPKKYSLINFIKEKKLIYQITSKELNWQKVSVFQNDNNIEYAVSNCEKYTYLISNGDSIKIDEGKINPNIYTSLIVAFPYTQYNKEYLEEKFDDLKTETGEIYYGKIFRLFLEEELNKIETITSCLNKKKSLMEMEKEILSLS